MTNEDLAQRIADLDEKISMIMVRFGLDPLLIDTEENDAKNLPWELTEDGRHRRGHRVYPHVDTVEEVETSPL